MKMLRGVQGKAEFGNTADVVNDQGESVFNTGLCQLNFLKAARDKVVSWFVSALPEMADFA